MIGRTRQTGFSLLEAIVALTLLAMSGAALFSWIDSSARNLQRASQATERALLRINAVELVSNINPAERPEGKIESGPFTFRWRTREIDPLQDARAYPRGMSLYQVGLFETTVEVSDQRRRRPLDSVTLRQIGWKKVRVLDLD